MNGSGAWNATGDGQYNGVLRAASSVNTTAANSVHVRRALVQVLSTSTARITPLNGTSVALDHCVDGSVFENAVRSFPLAIRDSNLTVFPANRAAVTGQAIDLPGNPLPAGTTINFSTSNGVIVGTRDIIVPNSDSEAAANWIHVVRMISDVGQVGTSCQQNIARNGVLTVRVTTPSGIVTTDSYPVTD